MAVPVNVSPLIKLCRWSFLAAGIVYGFDKHRKYKVEEAIFQEKNEKLQREKKAYLAQERERLNAASIAEIEGYLFGKPVPEQSTAADSDTSEDVSSDTSKDTLNDSNNDIVNDTNDDTLNDSNNDVANDTNNDTPDDTSDMSTDITSDMESNILSKETNDETSKGTNIESSRETSVESSKETNVESSKETCVASPNETVTGTSDKTNIVPPITEDIPLENNEAADELEVEEAGEDREKEMKSV